MKRVLSFRPLNIKRMSKYNLSVDDKITFFGFLSNGISCIVAL